MRTGVAVILLFIVFTGACGKDMFIDEDEIPLWLKERIAQDETAIESSGEQDMVNYGAWFRYKYKREYYFEYYNAFMSACCFMYDFEGTQMSYNDVVDYDEAKCCQRYVWKAPKYDALGYHPRSD